MEYIVEKIVASEHSYDHGAQCAWTRRTVVILDDGQEAVYKQWGRGIGYAPGLDLKEGDTVASTVHRGAEMRTLAGRLYVDHPDENSWKEVPALGPEEKEQALQFAGEFGRWSALAEIKSAMTVAKWRRDEGHGQELEDYALLRVAFPGIRRS